MTSLKMFKGTGWRQTTTSYCPRDKLEATNAESFLRARFAEKAGFRPDAIPYTLFNAKIHCLYYRKWPE
jgi:hypothetical protein